MAKSSVATSSVFEVGLPQAEQKATLSGNSVPQFEHLAMEISRYSLPRQDKILGPHPYRPEAESRKPFLYYHP